MNNSKFSIRNENGGPLSEEQVARFTNQLNSGLEAYLKGVGGVLRDELSLPDDPEIYEANLQKDLDRIKEVLTNPIDGEYTYASISDDFLVKKPSGSEVTDWPDLREDDSACLYPDIATVKVKQDGRETSHALDLVARITPEDGIIKIRFSVASRVL